MQLRGWIKQLGRDVGVDGGAGDFYINRSHALEVNTREAMVDAWTREGKVFILNNPVIGQTETMSGAGTAVTLTAPSLRFTVPAGVIAVPLWAQASIATVINKNDLFHVLVTDSDSYTSGGAAVPMTVLNALIKNGASLGGHGLTNIHYSNTAIVEGALSNPRLLKSLRREGQVSELNTTWNPEWNWVKGDPGAYLVGPASFLVYIVQETTPAEAEFSMGVAILKANEVGVS